MVLHAPTEQARGQMMPSTNPKTRAVPAFKIVLRADEKPGETEDAPDSNFRPSGIDYNSVKVPSSGSKESVEDRLDMLDLID
jgi:hypothetical protein